LTEFCESRTALKAGIGLLIPILLLLGATSPARAHEPVGDRAQSSVINGRVAPLTSFPWIAFIDYRGEVSRASCTGTVVAPRLILTAGHCVLSLTSNRLLPPSGFTVTTGQTDLRRARFAEGSAVSQVLVFPGYQASKALNDAALLVLSAPVPAPAIPLAQAGENLDTPGTPVAVAGWGLAVVGARKPSDVLREGTTVIQSPGRCRKAVRRITPFYRPSIQSCALAEGRRVTTCKGDSGGPAVARRKDGTPVQVGIISIGIPNCSPRYPEILTRAEHVSSWVTSWINAVEHGAPSPAVFLPPPRRLPRLTINAAYYYAGAGLKLSFRNRFRGGRFKRANCRRIERTKVKCSVFWYHNGFVYDGSITVYLYLPSEGSIWNYSFRIRKYRAYCWIYSPSLRSCRSTLFYR
jgi:hypothetical protein